MTFKENIVATWLVELLVTIKVPLINIYSCKKDNSKARYILAIEVFLKWVIIRDVRCVD